MPEVLTKPKTRAQQIRDLAEHESADFTADEYEYIKSLVSGWLKKKHPLRNYTVNKLEEATRVTRLEDTAI